ncbi:MAG: hypothetical protein KGL39_07885 [Patescibacteria group bacterium]|nr:hypothetical protein [Patescibacteria group bacterium]
MSLACLFRQTIRAALGRSRTVAEFRKTILKVGSFETREGAFLATPERLARFAAKFAEMKARGIKVPICWGHQPFAEPDDPESDPNDPRVQALREYLASRFNAGYFLDVLYHADRGELEVAGDVPGAEVDTEGNLLAWVQLPDSDEKVLTAIREVSAGVRNWTDGRGREWEDVIIHLALCVLPVVEGQGGFAPLSIGFDTGKPRVVYLSLSECISLATQRGLSMDSIDLKEQEATKTPADTDNAKTTMLDTTEGDSPTPKDAKSDKFKEVVSDLRELGIIIPDDTDPKQFLDHLRVAVKNALHHEGEEDDDDDAADDDELDPDAAALDTEAGEGDEDEKEEKMDKGSQTVEEPRPILMRTRQGKKAKKKVAGRQGAQPVLLSTMARTPTERLLLGREEKRARKDRIGRINRLVERRVMPVATGEELRKLASVYQLSLLPSGNAAKQKIDIILDTWEQAWPDRNGPDLAAFLLSTATEEERPDYASAAPTNQDVRQAAQERAAKMSRGNAKA